MYKRTALFAVTMIFSATTFAQCAMCKVVAESSIKAGESFGAGLNTGILYLMAFPYFLLLLFCAAWLIGKKRQTAKH